MYIYTAATLFYFDVHTAYVWYLIAFVLQLVIDPGTHNKSFGFESDMEKWPGRAQLEERLFHFPPNIFTTFDDFLKLSATKIMWNFKKIFKQQKYWKNLRSSCTQLIFRVDYGYPEVDLLLILLKLSRVEEAISELDESIM